MAQDVGVRARSYKPAIHVAWASFVLGAVALPLFSRVLSREPLAYLALAVLSGAHGWFWFRFIRERRSRRVRDKRVGGQIGELFERMEAEMYVLAILGVLMWLGLMIGVLANGNYLLAGLLGGGTLLAILIAWGVSRSGRAPRNPRRHAKAKQARKQHQA